MFDLKEGIKGKIIEMLVERHPLSAKEIFEQLKKHGSVHPYNYVHKCINTLVQRKIIEKEEMVYCLDQSYLEEIRNFLIRASSSYHIEQNVFLKSVTGSLLKMFNEKEAEIITTRILAEINEEIMKKLDDWYTEYYDPEKREFKKIVKELDPKGKRILEVGCGTGRITKEVGKVAKEVVAIDNNGSAVRYTKEKLSRLKNVTIEEGDVTKLKYKENEFDGILVSWAGLHYAADKEKIVKKLYAMLKPKGRIVILEAYADSEYIAILNKLKLKPSKIKEKQAELKEKLYSQFGNLKEEIVTTYYDFPSYAKLEEKFKIELGYEEGVNWTEEESKKLKVYMEKKKDLKVGEAFVVIVGEK